MIVLSGKRRYRLKGSLSFSKGVMDNKLQTAKEKFKTLNMKGFSLR